MMVVPQTHGAGLVAVEPARALKAQGISNFELHRPRAARFASASVVL